MFAENNMANNTYYHHLIKYAKNNPIIKITTKLRTYIGPTALFPAQINDYLALGLGLGPRYKRPLTWYLKVSLEGHCLQMFKV